MIDRLIYYRISLILISIGSPYSQNLLEWNFDRILYKNSFDYGNHWDQISSFESTEIYNFNIDSNSESYYDFHNMFITNDKNIFLINYFNFSFKNYFYLYVSSESKYVNNKVKFPKLEKNILGLSNNSKILVSGVGFQNNWVNLNLGRGRENWGSGNDINILLNPNSAPYNYFKLSSDYGKLRVNFLYGTLETVNNNINRNFFSRGIEYTNKNNFLISFSETGVYSGLRRSLEIGYLNPIGEALEIEWNDRLSAKGTLSTNSVWQSTIELLLKNNIRLSGNLLIDEFVLDRYIQKGRKHSIAYSFRISKSFLLEKNQRITLLTSFLKVGTPTFRHYDGFNNFVNNDSPLGWQWGSDGLQRTLGLNYFNKDKIIVKFNFKEIHSGELSLLKNPYSPYLEDSYYHENFPSGTIEKRKIISFNIYWKIKPLISLTYKGSFYKENDNPYMNIFILGFTTHFSKKVK